MLFSSMVSIWSVSVYGVISSQNHTLFQAKQCIALAPNVAHLTSFNQRPSNTKYSTREVQPVQTHRPASCKQRLSRFSCIAGPASTSYDLRRFDISQANLSISSALLVNRSTVLQCFSVSAPVFMGICEVYGVIPRVHSKYTKTTKRVKQKEALASMIRRFWQLDACAVPQDSHSIPTTNADARISLFLESNYHPSVLKSTATPSALFTVSCRTSGKPRYTVDAFFCSRSSLAFSRHLDQHWKPAHSRYFFEADRMSLDVPRRRRGVGRQSLQICTRLSAEYCFCIVCENRGCSTGDFR